VAALIEFVNYGHCNVWSQRERDWSTFITALILKYCTYCIVTNGAFSICDNLPAIKARQNIKFCSIEKFFTGRTQPLFKTLFIDIEIQFNSIQMVYLHIN